MTVRKTAKTTLSVIVLIAAFVFFRLYYIELLSRFINFVSGNEEYPLTLSIKLLPGNYIGAYFPALFYFGVRIVIIVCMLDAILDRKTALKLLSSFVLPLFLAAVISIALCIEQINLLQLWTVFYICIIICLHSTFRKIILHSESIGRHANLKLIRGFFQTIKKTVLKVISSGVGNFKNPIDEIISLSASAFVLLLETVTLISFIVYLTTYWRLIFLSHLIKTL